VTAAINLGIDPDEISFTAVLHATRDHRLSLRPPSLRQTTTIGISLPTGVQILSIDVTSTRRADIDQPDHSRSVTREIRSTARKDRPGRRNRQSPSPPVADEDWVLLTSYSPKREVVHGSAMKGQTVNGKRLAVILAATTAVGGSIVAVQGISSAATVVNVRLSNFTNKDNKMCLITDAETKCLGEGSPYRGGSSEVIQISLNSVTGMSCDVTNNDGIYRGVHFDREKIHECIARGDGQSAGFRLTLRRTDGVETEIDGTPVR
jgi:hypothetical protein